MCNHRKMDLVVCDKKLAIRSLLVLMLFAACLAVGSADLPSQCTMARPRSLHECTKKDRRFWYKESEGRCEPIGICPADVVRLDQITTNQNYFVTMEDCEKSCLVCSRLEAITNGNVVSENCTVGSTASYTCNHGYTLVGSSTRTCLSSGNWSGTEPYCQVQCLRPVVIDYGHPTAPQLTVGSISTYTCDEGYTLIGNATRVCMADGTWSGRVPLCGRVKIEYNSKDVTNSVLNISRETLNVDIECKMEPALNDDLQKKIIQEWRVTDGDNFRFPYEYMNVLNQPTLTYPRLFDEHKNNYTCKIGELKATVFLEVSEPTTPKPSVVPPEEVFLQKSKTLSSPQGQDISIACVFKGCPVPNVTWFHYNQSVLSDERRAIIVLRVPHAESSGYTYCSLTIQNAGVEDGGIYKCLGENSGGNVTSVPTVVEIENASVKRSADEQSSDFHCSTDSSTVTVVGKVRRSRPRRSEQTLHSYRVKVSRILRNSASYSKESKPLTVILTHNPDTIKLKRDTTYILTGHVVDNKILFVSSDNLIHLHTPELEDSIRSCQGHQILPNP